MNEIHPDMEAFLELSQNGYDSIPIYQERLEDRLTPVSLYECFRDRKPAILLESADRGEIWGRYSFLIIDPEEELRFNFQNNLISILEDKYPQQSVYPQPEIPFLGGAVGFFSYDAVKTWEKTVPMKPLDYPLAYFITARRFLYIDNLRHTVGALCMVPAGKIELYHKARKWIGEVFRQLEKDHSLSEGSFELKGEMNSNFSREEFMEGVEQIKQLIEEGHTSQVVLSQRFSAPFEGDPFIPYRCLRSLNPSPYLFFLDAGDFQMAGSSPEMLVKLNNGKLITKPIAGTRKRTTERLEAEIIQDLMTDEKENAEHVMLLDLGRNDLGRTCQPGTVQVDEFMTVERYSHVFHIVSQVSGQIQEACSPWKALQACFPAGTVSGAPKVRAMQIIETLEPMARGPYAGALGYVGENGGMDMCIVIRSLFFKDGVVSVQAGAGIVYDSIPANEYEETKSKAEALLRALTMAERRTEDDSYS